MTTALSVRDLRKTYQGNHEALKGVSLDVREGDFFALLGPNSAGKTTLIGIVASLVNKSGGTVSIFGNDLDREPASAKACIGLVPQEFNFNMFEPVVEVVANQAGYYGIDRREAFARAEKYLKHLDLWDKRRIMARNLSGGMNTGIGTAGAHDRNPMPAKKRSERIVKLTLHRPLAALLLPTVERFAVIGDLELHALRHCGYPRTELRIR